MPLESDWIKRFCAKLILIQPMTEVAAVEIAQRTYPDARDVAPEEAAEIYALEEPPADVDAPGN